MSGINKKGMAEIIQVSSILLLSILAIGLVWGYVADLGSTVDQQLSPTVDCITQQSTLISACINAQNQVQARIQIASGESIQSALFQLGQESFTCNPNTCTTCTLPQTEGTHTIYLEPQQPITAGAQLTTYLNTCPQPSTVSLTTC